MRRSIHALMMAAGFAWLMPTLSYAGCGDDAAALAQTYGISAATPSATTPSTSTTEKLAKSGGVIEPPSTGDMAFASPSVPNPEPMKTAPAVPPQTSSGAMEDKTVKTEDKAAAQTQASSLVQAAEEADGHGDEATCQQRLAAARALLKAPTSAP